MKRTRNEKRLLAALIVVLQEVWARHDDWNYTNKKNEYEKVRRLLLEFGVSKKWIKQFHTRFDIEKWKEN